MDERTHFFEASLSHERPRAHVINGCIRDPVIVGQLIHPTQLVINNRCPWCEVVSFISNSYLLAPFCFLVVVIGQEALFVVLLQEPNAKVEPNEVRLVAVNEFIYLCPPVIQKRFARSVLCKPVVPILYCSFSEALKVVQFSVKTSISWV